MANEDKAETTGPVGTSDANPVPVVPQPAAAADPEPKILEEVVTRVAKKPAVAVPPPPAAPIPAPAPQATPEKPLMPPVALPPLVVPTRPIPAAPVQKTPPVNPQKDLGADIEQILKDVKLPERRTVGKPIENKAATFDTTLGAAAEAKKEAAPAAVPPPAPEGAPVTSGTVVSVHTLKDDLQHVVRDQKMSLVHAASLEEQRRSRPKEQPAPTMHRSHHVFRTLFSVGLLLLLGAAAIFGVYIAVQNRTAIEPPITQSSILFAESSVAFPLDDQSPSDLKNTLANARANGQGVLGSITEIIPTISTTTADGSTQTRAATFEEFMDAIGANPPDDLFRALSVDFFFGFHTVDTEAPVFVIPVLSYDHAFADMLAWEPTMNTDLAPIFTAVPMTTTDANGLPVTRTFVDDVMHNYDVRELKDDQGNVELYYSFPTQNILVIAESPYSFTEILSRLQAAGKL